jgi:hypothetical protein
MTVVKELTACFHVFVFHDFFVFWFMTNPLSTVAEKNTGHVRMDIEAMPRDSAVGPGSHEKQVRRDCQTSKKQKQQNKNYDAAAAAFTSGRQIYGEVLRYTTKIAEKLRKNHIFF